jgi:hypothetical protein
MNTKNLITWKDADQNLCTIAASLLANAMMSLRGVRTMKGPWPTDDGEMIEPGFALDESSKRTVFSGDYDPRDSFAASNDNQPCPQCWWCFQNMITQKLRVARAELKRNCYEQNRKLRTSKQRSRNPKGRSVKSKFQRQQERTG